MTARLILLRHPEVAPQWRGRCYGQTDVGLSRAGVLAARRMAATLAAEPICAVWASPRRRARIPGARIAAALGVTLQIDDRLTERSFGAWEGRTWDAIWADTGSAMNAMIDAPATFRPGGGETTIGLSERVRDWFQSVQSSAVLAVSHGGPIAALAGCLRNDPVRDWLRYVPACGEGLEITPRPDGWSVAAWRPTEQRVRTDDR